MNVWLSLSRCGDEAPGLDLVPRHLDHFVATGTEGTYLDYPGLRCGGRGGRRRGRHPAADLRARRRAPLRRDVPAPDRIGSRRCRTTATRSRAGSSDRRDGRGATPRSQPEPMRFLRRHGKGNGTSVAEAGPPSSCRRSPPSRSETARAATPRSSAGSATAPPRRKGVGRRRPGEPRVRVPGADGSGRGAGPARPAPGGADRRLAACRGAQPRVPADPGPDGGRARPSTWRRRSTAPSPPAMRSRQGAKLPRATTTSSSPIRPIWSESAPGSPRAAGCLPPTRPSSCSRC